MKKIFLTVIMIPFFISCYQDKTEGSNDTELLKVKTDSLEVVFNTTYKDDVSLGYDDIFGNHYDINKGITKVPRRTFIVDNHWHHQIQFYIPDSIRKIEFQKDSMGFYFIETQNEKLNKILNFGLAYRKQIDPIETPEESLDRIFKYSTPTNDNDLRKRDSIISNIFSKKRMFLVEYSTKNHLGENFINSWNQIIYYEEISNKLELSQFDKLSFKSLSNLSVINNKFRSDSLLFIPYYRSGALSLRSLKHYLTYKNKDAYSLPYLMNISEKEFAGKTRDWIMLDLLIKSKDKNSGLKYSKQEYSESINRFIDICQTSEYKKYLQESISLENLSVKNNEVVNFRNDIFPFEKLLKNQFTYLDFWASWCAPCRAEMPESKKLKEKYSREGINFVYLSIDESPVAWKRAMKQVGLLENESYLLPKGNESTLAKQFKIQTIPRYILIGKDGKVINADAPRPSDPKIRQIFDDLLKK